MQSFPNCAYSQFCTIDPTLTLLQSSTPSVDHINWREEYINPESIYPKEIGLRLCYAHDEEFKVHYKTILVTVQKNCRLLYAAGILKPEHTCLLDAVHDWISCDLAEEFKETDRLRHVQTILTVLIEINKAIPKDYNAREWIVGYFSLSNRSSLIMSALRAAKARSADPIIAEYLLVQAVTNPDLADTRPYRDMKSLLDILYEPSIEEEEIRMLLALAKKNNILLQEDVTKPDKPFSFSPLYSAIEYSKKNFLLLLPAYLEAFTRVHTTLSSEVKEIKEESKSTSDHLHIVLEQFSKVISFAIKFRGSDHYLFMSTTQGDTTEDADFFRNILKILEENPLGRETLKNVFDADIDIIKELDNKGLFYRSDLLLQLAKNLGKPIVLTREKRIENLTSHIMTLPENRLEFLKIYLDHRAGISEEGEDGFFKSLVSNLQKNGFFSEELFQNIITYTDCKKLFRCSDFLLTLVEPEKLNLTLVQRIRNVCKSTNPPINGSNILSILIYYREQIDFRDTQWIPILMEARLNDNEWGVILNALPELNLLAVDSRTGETLLMKLISLNEDNSFYLVFNKMKEHAEFINFQNPKTGHTALIEAIYSGKWNIVKTLLSYSKINSRLCTNIISYPLDSDIPRLVWQWKSLEAFQQETALSLITKILFNTLSTRLNKPCFYNAARTANLEKIIPIFLSLCEQEKENSAKLDKLFIQLIAPDKTEEQRNEATHELHQALYQFLIKIQKKQGLRCGIPAVNEYLLKQYQAQRDRNNYPFVPAHWLMKTEDLFIDIGYLLPPSLTLIDILSLEYKKISEGKSEEKTQISDFMTDRLFDRRLLGEIGAYLEFPQGNCYKEWQSLLPSGQEILIDEARRRLAHGGGFNHNITEWVEKALISLGVSRKLFYIIHLAEISNDNLREELNKKPASARFGLIISGTEHATASVIDFETKKIYIVDPMLNNEEGSQATTEAQFKFAIKSLPNLHEFEVISPCEACVAQQRGGPDCAIYAAATLIGIPLEVLKIPGVEPLYTNPSTGQGYRIPKDNAYANNILGLLLIAEKIIPDKKELEPCSPKLQSKIESAVADTDPQKFKNLFIEFKESYDVLYNSFSYLYSIEHSLKEQLRDRWIDLLKEIIDDKALHLWITPQAIRLSRRISLDRVLISKADAIIQKREEHRLLATFPPLTLPVTPEVIERYKRIGIPAERIIEAERAAGRPIIGSEEKTAASDEISSSSSRVITGLAAVAATAATGDPVVFAPPSAFSLPSASGSDTVAASSARNAGRAALFSLDMHARTAEGPGSAVASSSLDAPPESRPVSAAAAAAGTAGSLLRRDEEEAGGGGRPCHR